MMTPYTVPKALQKGWRDRSQKAAAKHAAAKDPARLLAVRIRHRQSDLAEAGKIAADEFAATHAPIPSPIPQLVHADVAELLNTFLEQHGLVGMDLTQPIQPHETVEQITARVRVRLQTECDEAIRELAELEREKALERIRSAEAGLEAVEIAHTHYGISAPAVDLDAEPTRRGRGRPRRVADVIVDPDVPVNPE